MIARLQSAATHGIQASVVIVEANIEMALPKFTIVGLPDNAVKESGERVFAAIKNSSYRFPSSRITINLAPADIKKEGAGYDLPIAIGIIIASGQLQPKYLDGLVFIGELALDGTVRPVRGILPIAIELKKQGIKKFLVPRPNASEAALVEGLEVFPVDSLRHAAALAEGKLESEEPIRGVVPELTGDEVAGFSLDLADVKGQESVKRALEVAAAGGHNVIMIGPPGSGKTMLAKRLPGILPPMTFDEAIETTVIHSVSGLLPSSKPLVTQRPFRSPHHTISDAALVGGGTVPKPGEISLAHRGVLFLDELPEFARNVLEVLRQPLEDRAITVSRSKLTVDFPASFMLVCAMNPCPCGNYGNPGAVCKCTPAEIQRYMGKISGPLLDRIDIHIDVPAVKVTELQARALGEKSAVIRERIVKARAVQQSRFAGKKKIYCNGDMESVHIRHFCQIDEAGKSLLKNAIEKLGLSARAYDRILKVSRTIADLAGSESIKPEHLGEAIQYRSLDRSFYSI